MSNVLTPLPQEDIAVTPEVATGQQTAAELLEHAKGVEGRLSAELAYDGMGLGTALSAELHDGSNSAAMRKKWNEITDHTEQGTLDEVGIDTSKVDLDIIMGSIVSGEPPLIVEVAVDSEVNGWTRRLFEAASGDKPNVTIADEVDEDRQRDEGIHLSIVNPSEAEKHAELMAMLTAEGKDTSKYHILVVDPEKTSPLLASRMVASRMQEGLREVQDDLLFDVILDEGIETTAADSRDHAARVVAERFDRLNDDQARALLPEAVQQFMRHGEGSSERFKFCEKLYSRYGEALFEGPEFKELWQNPQFMHLVGMGYLAFTEKLNATKDQVVTPEATLEFREKLWNKFFESFGMDEKQRNETRAAWGARSPEEGLYNVARKEIRTLIELHTERPGSIKALYDAFGIRNFTRYQRGQLLRQLDTWENGVGADYLTLVISARDDWNGALESFPGMLAQNEERTTPSDVSEQMIFVEAGSSVEMLRRLVAVAKHGKAIDRLLMAAHGSKESIYFGKDRLTIDMVESSLAATRLKDRKIIEDKAEVILKACSVGKEGGIAQTIAQRVGVEVVGATENAPVYSDVKRPSRLKFWKRGETGRGTHYLSWPVDANQYDKHGRKMHTLRRVEF